MDLVNVMVHWLPWALLSQTRRRLAAWLLALVAVVGDGAGAAWSEVAPELEHSVKAAFLYKFLSFVEWPDGSVAVQRPLTIGVVEAEDIAAELDEIVPGRNVEGKPVSVRRLQGGKLPGDIDLVFVGRSAERDLWRLLPSARQQSTLVVCESVRKLPPGCAINFVLTDGRVRFEISQRAAEDSGLRLSSRLLSVALRVEGRTP